MRSSGKYYWMLMGSLLIFCGCFFAQSTPPSSTDRFDVALASAYNNMLYLVSLLACLGVVVCLVKIAFGGSEAHPKKTDSPLGTAKLAPKVNPPEPTNAELDAAPAAEPDGNWTQLETNGKWQQPPSSSQQDLESTPSTVPREGESARDRHRRWERDRFGLETRE